MNEKKFSTAFHSRPTSTWLRSSLEFVGRNSNGKLKLHPPPVVCRCQHQSSKWKITQNNEDVRVREWQPQFLRWILRFLSRHDFNVAWKLKQQCQNASNARALMMQSKNLKLFPINHIFLIQFFPFRRISRHIFLRHSETIHIKFHWYLRPANNDLFNHIKCVWVVKSGGDRPKRGRWGGTRASWDSSHEWLGMSWITENEWVVDSRRARGSYITLFKSPSEWYCIYF